MERVAQELGDIPFPGRAALKLVNSRQFCYGAAPSSIRVSPKMPHGARRAQEAVMTSRKAIVASFLTVLVASISASAHGASTPLEGTQDLVAAVKAGTAKADTLGKVKEYFDYDHLVKQP